MRNTDKYYYVEVALPKDNPAIQNMVAESERTNLPLRVFIKKACIDQYGEHPVEYQRSVPKVVTKPVDDNTVHEKTDATANALLDDGF